jgi:pyridoxine 4-dehydrogenase
MEPRRHVLGPATVSRVGFGAMQLPGPGVFGPPRDRAAAVAVLRRAVELGVDHIDTAQYYGPGVASELIRTATLASPVGDRSRPEPARHPGSGVAAARKQ